MHFTNCGICVCRYMFFLQLKHDIYAGRLTCEYDTLVELAALSLQCKTVVFCDQLCVCLCVCECVCVCVCV